MPTKKTQKLHPAVIALLILLSLITLCFTAFAIGDIIFLLIDKFIPDPVHSLSAYRFNSIKFSIASLITTAPIYIILINYLQKSLKNGRLPFESSIRKWLGYFSILVSSCIIIGIWIAVIVNFLDGDLTLRFFLQLLTVFLISAGILFYNILNIKRSEIKKHNIIQIIFNSIVIPLSIIALVFGFIMMEPPSQTRARRLDENKLRTINSIRNQIDTHYINTSSLPTSLDQINLYNKDEEEVLDQITFSANPEELSYELCTDFNLSSEEITKYGNTYYLNEFEFEAGHNCFDIEIQRNNGAINSIVK